MNFLDTFGERADAAEAEKRLQVEMDRLMREPRWRAVVMSSVAAALHDHGPVDPQRADREAHDIALTAVRRALAMVIGNDSALRTLEAERDLYRDRLIGAAHMQPPPRIILASGIEARRGETA